MSSHQQIAHRWAQRDENLNLKGFAVYAEGFTIFSWGAHFPIARHFTAPNGQPAIWFNARGYSSSTAKHKSYVQAAIGRDAYATMVFALPDDMWIPDYSSNKYMTAKQVRDAIKCDLQRAFGWLEARALETFQKSTRARSNAYWLQGQAHGFLQEAANLANYYGVKYTAPDFSELAAAAEKRAIEQAKAKAKADKARAKAQKEAYAKARAGFEAGERLQTYNLFDLDGTALVRHSLDGKNLETSQGAVVPWPHAVAVFRKVKACREAGISWCRNPKSETLRAGHFDIHSIAPDGSMVAGCHSFSWANMEALAIKEGIY